MESRSADFLVQAGLEEVTLKCSHAVKTYTSVGPTFRALPTDCWWLVTSLGVVKPRQVMPMGQKKSYPSRLHVSYGRNEKPMIAVLEAVAHRVRVPSLFNHREQVA